MSFLFASGVCPSAPGGPRADEKVPHLGLSPKEEVAADYVISKHMSSATLAELAKLPYALSSMISAGKAGLQAKGTHRKGGKGKHSKNVRSKVRESADGKNWSMIIQSRPATTLPQRIQNLPFNITQEANAGTLVTTSTSTPSFGSLYFTVAGLDQISSLTAVFDQYRVNMVEAWILPFFGTSNGYTSYASVIDYDDASNLTTYAQALDYTNVVETQISNGHYRKFVPHIAVAAYSGSFTSYENVTAPWIDCSSTAVQHYGLKIASPATSVSSTITATYRLHVSFRNVR